MKNIEKGKNNMNQTMNIKLVNKIDLKFKELKERGEKALVTFITAGDPDLETSFEIILAMEKAGVDIVEIGIPYSDPLADGEVIQEASERALKSGTNIPKVIEMISRLRKESEIPIVFLMYYNCLFKYGMKKFFAECRKVQVDGIVIPDIPIEEREEVTKEAISEGIYLIPLVAPTSKERIKNITKNGKGFVYCVSVNGVTGVRKEIDTDIKSYMELVKSYTETPALLGFGISNVSMVNKIKSYCDGVIIGSAIVKKVALIKKENNAKELIHDGKNEYIEDNKKVIENNNETMADKNEIIEGNKKEFIMEEIVKFIRDIKEELKG